MLWELKVEPAPLNQVPKFTSAAVAGSIAKKLPSATTPKAPVSRLPTREPLLAIGTPTGR